MTRSASTLVSDADFRALFRQHILATLPGLLMSLIIAASAYWLREVPGLATSSPLILAILIGIVFHNLAGTPAIAKPGVAFSMRRILRLGIILLGFQLTAGQIIEVGYRGFLIIATTLTATFLFTVWMGRLLGVERKLAQLIAAGTSICGASAVIATNTVTNGDDEDVAYAVACVTIFGSVAMFTYPLLPAVLHLDPHAYGLWTGASIHEIAPQSFRVAVFAARSVVATALKFGYSFTAASIIFLNADTSMCNRCSSAPST